jgi:hypothetical protein
VRFNALANVNATDADRSFPSQSPIPLGRQVSHRSRAGNQPVSHADRYLSDYPNMYGDLSAGSGLNALTRDEDHAREFIQRHQDKLLFGGDCNDHDGQGSKCSGAGMIAVVRRLSPSKEIERKLLYRNARRVFSI